MRITVGLLVIITTIMGSRNNNTNTTFECIFSLLDTSLAQFYLLMKHKSNDRQRAAIRFDNRHISFPGRRHGQVQYFNISAYISLSDVGWKFVPTNWKAADIARTRAKYKKLPWASLGSFGDLCCRSMWIREFFW